MYDEALMDFLFPSKETAEDLAYGVGLDDGHLKRLIQLIHRKKLKLKTREQIIDELELDEEDIELLDDFDSYSHLL